MIVLLVLSWSVVGIVVVLESTFILAVSAVTVLVLEVVQKVFHGLLLFGGVRGAGWFRH
jgi:hypothetical protein